MLGGFLRFGAVAATTGLAIAPGWR